ncbi:hypothetical protein RN001_011267 [Aquatica leii]|uniref:Uncharacterized protein n=1 Tax=Aquatica leii TaxID=1421715 RepID=A0AAN7S8W3_9COLE|nr:hypothetical protein RN001_011267 [Aquatica leii]
MAPVRQPRKPKSKIRIQPWATRWWSRDKKNLPQAFLTRAPTPDVPKPPVSEDDIKELQAKMDELFGPSPAALPERTPTYQVEELSLIRNIPVGLESPSPQTMKEIEISRHPLDRKAPFFISIPCISSEFGLMRISPAIFTFFGVESFCVGNMKL